MATNISSAMKEHQSRAFKMLAVALSLIVYAAGLVYAGVRSFSLFAATIDPALLPLAVVGIVALEVTAVALPLAIHFWTQPGAQRLAAMGFYVLDLALIASNAILDAANHSGAHLFEVLAAYGVYILPALPLLCMAGWSLIWLLDPTSRERDMREAVKAATHEALLSQIQKAVEQADITQAVESAASEAARALVGETLGSAPRRVSLPATVHYNAQAGDDIPTLAEMTGITTQPKRSRNGRKATDVNAPKSTA